MAGDSAQDGGHFKAAYTLETNEQTREHYSSWAESYDQEVSVENGYAQPERVAHTLAELYAGKSIQILDAGCGSGLSGLALKQAGFSTIDGCDFSPEMLEKSLEKACYRNLFEADLNAGQANIAANHYDVVTCVGVFSFGHVFPDACDDLLRILKPKGHLIIAVNVPYWEQGELTKKIDALENSGNIEVLKKELGEHLPGHDVMGWVITLQKCPETKR